MSESKLQKRLFIDINKLKSCDKTDSPVRFSVDHSSFNSDGEQEETGTSDDTKEIRIIGRIYPNSEIFKEGAFQIEIRLSSLHPFEPPKVRFITPIYHPNVGTDGRFYDDLLRKTARWTINTSLVAVVTAVTDHIDHPDIENALRIELAREYLENRDEFNRKALESVQKSALPRE